MDRPKAILFDLLTGLLNSWDIWDKVIPENERGISDGQTWRKRYLEITFSCENYQPYEALVNQAAADVGLSSACTRALVEQYDSIGNNPWPEVPEVLARLKAMDYKLAVATNISHELGLKTVNNLERQVREKTSAKDFTFDVVVTAEECGFYKPNPRPYKAALNKLGLNADQALFVAGSPTDIEGASNVGLRVVWNNHISLANKGNVAPLKEAKSLDEALGQFLA